MLSSLYKQKKQAVEICCMLVFTFSFVCFQAAGAEDRNPLWAVAVELPGSENLYQVTPDIYRSAQPSRQAMQSYEQHGIRSVINLRNHHDDKDEAKDTKLLLYHIPINTWSVTDAHVVEALAGLRTVEKPVLVHCMHGADRTGLIIAMYRIVEQGWTKEAALTELMEGGYGFHAVWKNIPRYVEEADIAAIRQAVENRAARLRP